MIDACLNFRMFKKLTCGLLLSLCLLHFDAKAQGTSEPRFLLLIYASGGWDSTMVFDNKINSPYVNNHSGSTAVHGGGNIPYVHHADRPAVRTWFDNYGSNAVIINGVHTPSLDPQGAFRSMFTVTPPGKFRPIDFMTYYAASLRPNFLAPHIVFDAPYASGDYSHITAKITRTRLSQYLSTTIPNATTLTTDQESNLLGFQKKAWSKGINALHQASLDADRMRAAYGNLLREQKLGESLRAISSKLGSQGAESNFLRTGKIALEMFASGASLSATIQAGRAHYWDSSVNHFNRQNAGFQNMFSDLSLIMNHAQSLGLLDKISVIVASETGKSPRLNDRQGKDPWPFTSVLLWGGIFRGGSVQGVTDPFLRGIPIDPIFGNTSSDTKVVPTMGHIFSAIYSASGVPYKLILPNSKPLSIILSADPGGALR